MTNFKNLFRKKQQLPRFISWYPDKDCFCEYCKGGFSLVATCSKDFHNNWLDHNICRSATHGD